MLTSRGLEVGRKVALFLGVVYGALLLVAIFALVTNFLPRYTASSASPGSGVLLHVISVIPWLPAAFLGGFAVVLLLNSRTPWRWAIGLAAFLGYQQLVSWSYGWSWLRMDLETKLGMVTGSVLIAGAALLGSALALRRQHGGQDAAA